MGVLRATTVLILIAVQLFACVAIDICYAPKSQLYYGSECRSSTEVLGSPGHRVRYSVSVRGNADTLVCCQGYAAMDSRFHKIGCGIGSFSKTLNWGNNLANPKIKCKAVPNGAYVFWRH